jgi:rubrerythrin
LKELDAMKMKNMDFAIQMERDGYEFYTQAAASLKDKAAQTMLLSLAKDEQKHEQIIRDMEAGHPALFRASDFTDVKNVFKLLAESDGPVFKDANDLTRVLKKGIQIEKKSVELYESLAEQASDPDSEEIFTRLAEEEGKHQQILEVTLDNLYTPRIILENAEFLFYNHENLP